MHRKKTFPPNNEDFLLYRSFSAGKLMGYNSAMNTSISFFSAKKCVKSRNTTEKRTFPFYGLAQLFAAGTF